MGDFLGLVVIGTLVGLPYGLGVGLGLGALGGALLGGYTAANPRPAALRAAYRRRAVPVAGALMGLLVALVLGPLRWQAGADVPPFVQRTPLDQALDLAPVLFVAVEAGVAAGWSTCRLLGWYARRPD